MNLDQFYCRQLGICSVGLILTLVFVGLAQPGYAQGTGGSDPAESPKQEDRKYTLAGTVVNSETGEVIRRAAVVISGNGSGATLTDSSGHFEFPGLAEGRIFVSVAKPGFFNEQATPSGRITVQVSPETPPVVLKMVPAGVVVGRVTTRDGDPIDGVLVRVIAKQNMEGRPVWFDRQNQTLTDENGDFRVANLPASTYYVAVDQSQETALSQPGIPNGREQSYPRVFYPGVSEFSAAALLELRAGQEVRANFTLTAEPVYQVSGVVNGYKDLPSGLVFTRQAGEGVDFTQNVPVEDGKFQAKLLAGSYSIRGSTTNGTLMSTGGSNTVIRFDSPHVHIVLAPAPSIPVAVRTESIGGGIEHADNLGSQSMPVMTLRLVPSEPSLFHTGAWWRPQSGDIQNVEPGVYNVEINTVSPWRVKSVQCGNVDLLHDDLTVAAGARSSSIDVVLRDDAATVSGMVAQIEPWQQATVLLVQPHGSRNLVKAVITTEGRFQFEGIAPGDYALLAFNNADQLEYTNFDVLNSYLPAASHITVQPRGATSFNLTLLPTSR